ncbi:fumarate/nitrate reduction transcriptional regulator Fnr [Leeia aquatica]|uniref:Fumarate/nitrate reduction transcriptional regulator Fnr n=1 Tax=Leeia aquatica TaxID=2725557 RepID=A0A847S7K6_9NEIS|nr:fumarate/nitrate reduction transcriptional regulator Fnr [Leeia aquatica]NLR73616.1 fumarate/nitrate reduction transcriptional regulator Fnr [Leeia aquatica]
MNHTSTIPIQEVSLKHLKVACSSCSLRELCLPLGLNSDEMNQLETVITQRVKVKKGEPLYRAGDAMRSLFAVRLGFFKMSVLSEDGREQVTGFQMAGELLGLDAISTETHSCGAIALEDSEVCEIPFADLEELSRHIPSLQNNFYKVLSREIVRDHGVMMLLGNMKAEERLAAFLLNLSQRFALRGYSSRSFVLRMTREEIGSYLGLKLETISRGFSRFQEQGLIRVHNKEIEILDLPALKQVLSGCSGKA